MKIASISCVYPPYRGGIGSVAKQYSEILAELGHSVEVFSVVGQDGVNEGKPIKIHDEKSFIKYGKGAVLFGLIKKLDDFDLVYFHYPFFGTNEIVWFYKKILRKKIKLITHFHMDVNKYSSITKFLGIPSVIIRNSLFNASDKIVSASMDYVASSSISTYYENHKKKFVELPFGVDPKIFYPGDKKNNGILNLLFVGGLDRAHYFKGVDCLLDSLLLLKDYKWRLSIVGDGDLKRGYIEKTKKIGLENKVNFLGNLSPEMLSNEYRKNDLLVLPSINSNEAFGIVLVEAMMSGTALIASSLPGVRKVFRTGFDGYTFKPGDPEELADKIKLFLKDSSLSVKMGHNACRYAKVKYSISNIRTKLNNLIENI